MEKLCLKWNDFQTNVSNSIGLLRDEKNLFDVTLVSDEGDHISAHRLVLSACSEFFRNVFIKVNNQNPLIFLSGVSSTDLRMLLDYMYQGEAQIYQDDLSEFLEVADKLKINGLMDVKQETLDVSKNNLIDTDNQDLYEECFIDYNSDVSRKLELNKEEDSLSLTIEEGKRAVDELIFKEGDLWFCKSCDLSTKVKAIIRHHAETHIDGLLFFCPVCEQSFGSRKKLSNHKMRKHQSIKMPA